jgi:hypothetical protein
VGSALPETAGSFDLGPPTPLALDEETRSGRVPLSFVKEWAAQVCHAAGGLGLAKQSKAVQQATGGRHSDIEGHRRAMKEWARSEYGWGGVAEQWSSLFGVGI